MNPMITFMKKQGLKVSLPLLLLATGCDTQTLATAFQPGNVVSSNGNADVVESDPVIAAFVEVYGEKLKSLKSIPSSLDELESALGPLDEPTKARILEYLARLDEPTKARILEYLARQQHPVASATTMPSPATASDASGEEAAVEAPLPTLSGSGSGATSVPEPATLAGLAIATLGMGAIKRKRAA